MVRIDAIAAYGLVGEQGRRAVMAFRPGMEAPCPFFRLMADHRRKTNYGLSGRGHACYSDLDGLRTASPECPQIAFRVAQGRGVKGLAVGGRAEGYRRVQWTGTLSKISCRVTGGTASPECPQWPFGLRKEGELRALR